MRRSLGVRRRTLRQLRPEDSGNRAVGLVKRHNVRMDLESATTELYAVVPAEFTAARNAKASEARKAGLADVAVSLKQLRKPSAAAWLANLLVRQRSDEIDRLIELGDGLRGSGTSRGRRDPEGLEAEGRRHHKTHSICKIKGLAIGSPGFIVSGPGARDDSRRRICGSPGRSETPSRSAYRRVALLGPRLHRATRHRLNRHAKGSGPARDSKSEARRIAARRELDKANREAEQADAHVEKARRAVKEAAAALTRLESAEAKAVKRSRDAHAHAAAVKKRLSKRL